MKTIRLFLIEPYDQSLLPVQAYSLRDWWEQDVKTKNHARFCHPLRMANQLGFYILSSTSFTVEWDGDEEHDVVVEVTESSSHTIVDTHSAHGSFTVQPNFIPMTDQGDFVYIKNVPNVRRPFTVMEGMIETWWNPANFGIVALCNQAGKFAIKKGEPLAQMILINEDVVESSLDVAGADIEIPYRPEFIEKRANQEGHVLDYMKGLYPDGTVVELHYKSFKGTSPNTYRSVQEENVKEDD